MKYKLENIDFNDLSDLKKKVSLGARFVVFNYRISLGLISLLRVSPAIYIREKSELNKFKKKYNNYNLIFGPWYFFKGPWLTYNAYKINNSGGIDVTNDIMHNITEGALIEKEVNILEIHDLFIKIKNSDLLNIKKALQLVDKKKIQIEKAFTGIYINVEEYESPYFVIGVKMGKYSLFDEKTIRDSLYKIFYKHVRFEIFDIDKETELGKKLILQGNLVL
ncbi:hypothetical protein [Flavobacterium sp.]|uniref:hypothetical protein n=1 Tax=Flavobacterium sp. TaxID=239 RepID=UPI000EC24CC2|nr:hypothetical protein [Flavobacterium sp.]HCQ12920.1 hypothetical protein [Flavobacterium sp.]